MTYFPQPNPVTRATRVKLGGSVLVAIRSEVSGTVRAKLQVLSATGGLFILAKPLEQGDFVQVTFQTSQGPVRGMAEMLQPTGAIQPPAACNPFASWHWTAKITTNFAWSWSRCLIRLGLAFRSGQAGSL